MDEPHGAAQLPGRRPADEPAHRRCRSCGIESAEPTCFVDDTRKAGDAAALTCLGCAGAKRPETLGRALVLVIGCIMMPVCFTMVATDLRHRDMGLLLMAALLMLPLLVLLHELGHCAVARLVGLESDLITLGIGPRVGQRRVLGVRFRLHAWPIGGFTSLGARSLRALRSRLWLTTLAGPLVHIVLAGGAMVCFRALAMRVSAPVVILWCTFNLWLAFMNLLPHRVARNGGRTASDGRLLLDIPFMKPKQRALYLVSSAMMNVVADLEDGAYAAGRETARQSLDRVPDSPWMALMLSSCEIGLGNYAAGRDVLTPVLGRADLESLLVAAVHNNLAMACWLAQADEQAALQRAAALSAQAFAMYPCFLSYRSTRALIVAALGSPEEALSLLEYPNYRAGTAESRGYQQIARAYALRKLGRMDESASCLANGVKLLPHESVPFLAALGWDGPAHRAGAPLPRHA